MRTPKHRSALIALVSVGPLAVAACGDSGTCSGPLCGDDSTVATVEVTTTTLPSGSMSVAYSLTLTATGGDGTYTWSVTVGALPLGLSLATNGAITGTPTARRNVIQRCCFPLSPGCFGMYRETVARLTVKPSFPSSA